MRHHPPIAAVEAAMSVLLPRRQIDAVRARTFLGRSKVELVRRIFELGLIRLEQAEMAGDLTVALRPRRSGRPIAEMGATMSDDVLPMPAEELPPDDEAVTEGWPNEADGGADAR